MFIRWKRRTIGGTATYGWVVDANGREVVKERDYPPVPPELAHHPVSPGDAWPYHPRFYVRTGGKPLEIVFSIQLVESYRRGGKPRQRVVAHLGSIREKYIKRLDTDWSEERCWHSWVRAGRRLDRLVSAGTITADEAALLKSQITERLGVVAPESDPQADLDELLKREASIRRPGG
jgi:hypothetical protein